MNRSLTNGSTEERPRRLAILGATGSIGTQTLDIVRLFPDQFDVRVLSCDTNVELLAKQAREFQPTSVAVGTTEYVPELREALAGTGISIHAGEEGLCDVATRDDVDVVVGAVVGFAGLAPVLEALKASKQVALANKETLVVGGALVNQALSEGAGRLLPVDSEHSAIFQCLAGESERNIEQIVLTASGGPFRTRSADTFEDITVAEALDHPNWSMGAKVTVDSATMMNKGLEVIEARWLFGLELDQIQVLVHPQSIIHSMVTFTDGAVKAQLGVPDMKVPIQYALSFPARWPAPHERIDWSTISQLEFELPDTDKFPCLRLAYDALLEGGTAPAVLNASNEAAVDLFLDERIAFTDIPRVIERALQSVPVAHNPSLEDLYAADEEARRFVEELPLPASN